MALYNLGVLHRAVAALSLMVWVAAGSSCSRPGRENTVDPAILLTQLAQAASARERLGILDALSTVQPASVPPNGPDAIHVVRPLLAAADPIVAAKAGDLLAHWGDGAATPGLLRLLSDADPLVRFSAASSLTTLADPAAQQPLLRATADTDAAVRAQACTALAALDHHAGAAAVAALRARLGDRDDAVRAAAARALGRIGGSDHVPELLPLLHDSDPGVVGAAAAALGNLRDRRAVTPLVTLLEHSNQAVRGAAAVALGSIGDASAVGALVHLLEAADSALRVAALGALGAIGDPAGIDGVLTIAGDAEPRVAERVPYVLVQLYSAQRFDEFAGHVESGDPSARSAVALALGLTDERRAVPALTRALADPVAHVRGQAAAALGLLGATEALSAVGRLAEQEPDPEAREAASIGLALELSHASGVAPRLVSCLADANPRVRIFAADALGLLRVGDAAPALRPLAQQDVDADARNAAMLALLRIADGADL